MQQIDESFQQQNYDDIGTGLEAQSIQWNGGDLDQD